jgi:hypothetical protein
MTINKACSTTCHLITKVMRFSKPDGMHPWRKTLCLAISVVSMILFRSACATALGMPISENTAKLGYALGMTYVAVDDPAKPTTGKWATVPLTLIHTDWLIEDIRYWSEAFYYNATLDAGVNRIGEDVEHYGLRFSLQKSLSLSHAWAPWFGIGIGVSQASYTTRYTADADGFLLAVYPDRKQTSVALLINVVNEWPLDQNWDIAAKLETALPVTAGILGSTPP